ncbi:18S rRNA (guanine1575-N7)-methyltransferase [Schistosoma japonicum]|nr:18S rRNA (guanine1575-N7)-methyltransferase [Schistosoma japonicum]
MKIVEISWLDSVELFLFLNQFILSTSLVSFIPCYLNKKDKIFGKLPSVKSIRRGELLHKQLLQWCKTDLDQIPMSKCSQLARSQHQSRQYIQLALYDYVINHLLGLCNQQSNSNSNHLPLVLDLGCGINQTDIINHYTNIMPNFSKYFIREIQRLLNYSIGQCILQFYPTTSFDLQRICETIEKIAPKLIGCQLICQPVVNRGMKIFIYLTNNQ